MYIPTRIPTTASSFVCQFQKWTICLLSCRMKSIAANNDLCCIYHLTDSNFRRTNGAKYFLDYCWQLIQNGTIHHKLSHLYLPVFSFPTLKHFLSHVISYKIGSLLGPIWLKHFTDCPVVDSYVKIHTQSFLD